MKCRKCGVDGWIGAESMICDACKKSNIDPHKVLFDKGDNARNYPEDYADENGNYACLCSGCGFSFWGHKRRVTCKACMIQSLSDKLQSQEKEIERLRKEADEHVCCLDNNGR